MNASPRLLNHRLLVIFVTLIFAFASSPVLAQQRRGRARHQSKPSAQSKEAQRVRQAQAISLLAETADKARLIDDLFYRARIQTIAADALWRFDEQRARAIFRRAWEAATAADKAEQEEIERESGARPRSTSVIITDSRDEVLKAAAAHDPQLAGVFLHELSPESDADKSAAQNQMSQTSLRQTPWRELSATGARRLALAYDLLNQGQYARAAQIAAPIINEGVSGDLMTFILRLHWRAEGFNDSNELYLRLVERTAADPTADANALLLLSSRIASPHLLVVVDENGALQFRSLPHWTVSSHQTQADHNVNKAFYNLAVSVLLRPANLRGGVSLLQENTSRYFAIGRLLSLFESGAPEYAQYAPELRARYHALAGEIEANRRDTLAAQTDLRSLTPKRVSDPLGPMVEQLARAKGAVERDRIALTLVRTAAQNRLWDRARRIADAMEDLSARRTAHAFIAVSQIADISRAYADDKEQDFESVAKFVHGADVPLLARAWGMAQAALIAARQGKMERAGELIDEAERYAARVDHGSHQRVAAYGVAVMAAAQINKQRAWELLVELIRAANALDDYAGDEVSLDIAPNENLTEDSLEDFRIQAKAFRLDVIFATMAHLDFDKALAEARALQGDVPQAFASIATARAMLESRP